MPARNNVQTSDCRNHAGILLPRIHRSTLPRLRYRGTSRIPATYLPPLSDPGYDRTIRNAKTLFFNEINQLAFTDNNVFELDDDEVESSRVKRELKLDEDDLLSKRIIKRESNQEHNSEQEVIS